MKMTPSERIGMSLIGTFMLIFAFIVLYPLVHVVMAAFSDPFRLLTHRGPIFAPLGFSLKAFDLLFGNQFILGGLFNSFFLIVVGVSFNIVMTAIAAFVLSKRQARLVKYFSIFIVFTMLFSGGLIPLYLTVRNLGLINSLFSLILPFSIGMMNLIILRTAIEGVPASLEESARIDGAGHLTILVRIILPLVMPTIAVLLLYYAVEKWNSWFYASLFLKDKSLYPLQLILRELLIDNDSGAMTAGSDDADRMMLSQSIRYAAMVVGTLPVLFLYPFLQRYFVKGSLIGAVKE